MTISRRSLFGAVAGAAAAGIPTALGPVQGRITRVSIEKDDPGYRAYCMARGDDLGAYVYLDGVEQPNAVTADSREGLVKRVVITANGNIAHDGENILHEIVHGTVVIEIRPISA